MAQVSSGDGGAATDVEDNPSEDSAFYFGLIIFGSVVFLSAVVYIFFRVCCQSFFAICLPDSSLTDILAQVKHSAFTPKAGLILG
jgi:hypothetical protein